MTDQTTTISELKDLLARFVAERDWEQFHNPKNLSMSIAIEAAELMEHFQWVRTDELDSLMQEESLRADVGEELSDIVAFILSLANVLKIDLSDAFQAKMVKNAQKYPAKSLPRQI
jgi:NTP pyrophosphatase (non-canonical NTP hydrolase)